MEDNIVIVESPAKAKTIEKFLGKNFLVKSSFGHVRDLSKKKLGVDIENNYEPDYEISPEKKAVVKELKSAAKKAKTVWLASDEDREGEAIAWHLYEVLNLKNENTKRIVFHEITKEAIVNAIDKPRSINKNLVDAQQARRILDRLVGFELSPVLWKKIKPALSAGRVQSVAVRLIVEREREIIAFKSVSSYKVTGYFFTTDGKKAELKAELSKKFKTKDEALAFLEDCKKAGFKIKDIITKPSKKSPAAPFTTSTLQQDASRKLGFSVAQTMTIAQRLYEAGKITYMRTDSVNLSNAAVGAAKEEILRQFGEKYHKARKYTTKTKGAQEAHEAIRPTYIQKQTVGGTNAEKKLYELIWKRTIASQMSDAKLEKTTATIDISNRDENFVAVGEILKFDGFLKVYFESTDDENGSGSYENTLLPPLHINDKLDLNNIKATEKFSHHPPRYTEASLVKKLEELGIGRPSTYAPIISTVQQRGYVLKESRDGRKRKFSTISLQNGKIDEQVKTETTGTEKNKLFPTDIGMVVNDFLIDNFKDIMNFDFTATVEKEFDEIATGKIDWHKMIDEFYKPFHKTVEETLENTERRKGERYLGEDPKSGNPVYARIGRYGPIVQIGEKNIENGGEKPKFASLRKGQHIETITLEEALELFKLPRNVGKYEDKDVVIGIGRFGPYVRHDGKFVSLKKEDDPLSIKLDRAIQLIEDKREAERKKLIKTFEEDKDLKVLNGRWGPYISYKKKNYKIPKKTNPEELSYEDCQKLIEQGDKAKSKKSKGKTSRKKK